MELPTIHRSARDKTLALLALRAPGATICPSEVARALTAAAGTTPAEADWREAMPVIHTAVDQLMDEGLVHLSWKGELLKSRVGPYRIRRAHDPD